MQLVVLDSMNLDPFMEELQHTADTMGTDDFEYRSIKQITESRDKDKKTIIKMIAKHIKTFSCGVLENVLAAYISRGG